MTFLDEEQGGWHDVGEVGLGKRTRGMLGDGDGCKSSSRHMTACSTGRCE